MHLKIFFYYCSQITILNFRTMKISLFTFRFCTFLILNCVSILWALNAQEISYAYDNAGNRIKREIMIDPQNIKSRSSEESFQESLSSQNVKIYPNPTIGHLKIEFSNYSDDSDYILELFNSQGQSLYHIQPRSSITEIDITDKQAGLYILKITIDSNESTWKIIKK